MKKILLMLCVAISCNLMAEENKYLVDGLWYELITDVTTQEVQARVFNPNYPHPYPEGDVVIPDQVLINGQNYTVSAIRGFTFETAEYGKKIWLPNTLKTIGAWAIGAPFLYEDCPGYATVTNVPESLEIIEDAAFGWTTLPESVNLPNIRFIGPSAIRCAKNINSLRLGSNLSAIHSHALSGAPITELIFEDGNHTSYYNGTHPYISNLAFMIMPLKELKLPKWENMALGDCVISNCSELERVVFPDVEYIEYGYDYYFRPSAIIKTRVYGCFIYHCPKLKEVVCDGKNPPEITALEGFKDRNVDWGRDVDAFDIVDNMDGCVLKVPAGSEELYRAHPVWGRFQTILGFENGDYDLLSINSVEADENAAPVYYNLQGIQVKDPVKGQLYIRKAGAETTKVIM